jgi:hypothetical protein
MILVPSPGFVNVRIVPYTFLWNCTRDSPVVFVCTYAMSLPYSLKKVNARGYTVSFGGFCCFVRLQCWSHAAVVVPRLRPWMYSRHRNSDLHFAKMSIKSQPPTIFRVLRTFTGTRNIEPCHTKYVMAVVSCCIFWIGARKICVAYQIFASI